MHPVSNDGARWRDIRQAVRLLRSEADRLIVARGMATVALVIVGGVIAALSPLVLKSLVDEIAASPPGAASRRWSSALPYGAAYLLLLLAGRAMTDVRPLLTGAINQ